MTGPERYFSLLVQTFEATALAHGGPFSHDYEIAGHPVRVKFASRVLVAHLTSALAHLPSVSGHDAPLKIMVWNESSAATPMPVPPWSWKNYMARGEIGGLDPDRYRVWFHVASGVLSMIDFDARRAVLWVRDVENLPIYVIAAPFRMILQAWLNRRGLNFAHAAAVGTPAGGVLLAGAGGSGKSTTSLACLDAGMAFVSDDYCLVAAEPSPRVHTVYCSAKADDGMLQNFPRLGPSRQARNDPPGEKTLLMLQERFSHQLLPNLTLRALLAPTVSDLEESSLNPVRALEAIRALAPSSMEQIAGPDASAWKTFTALARQLPCYRLHLGRNVKSTPAVISRLLEDLQMQPSEQRPCAP